ncbi:methylation-associated defense system ATP-binding protein MAD8 [Chryseobacterium herbae]|uniref:ATP-binding protein n=1 Tax=Chryseobacterium herbae TaxID=2976476 RepID=A0ABT2IT14_9FLAO|nr:ATP-binding protein [Chryseobacterium sp. pc1-10]MCT2561867.1 ATP-binding protein [Chryseobacterium sp. pc1-10]
MEILKTPNTYYRRIIDLILELHKGDLSKTIAGHCMKITGLGLNELDFLWNVIHVQYPNIDTFIVSEERNDDRKFISATKLIELRNKQDAPLLVLIPSNSRTAAEDSYGNATFKEISLEGIEANLKNDLLDKIPDRWAHIIRNEVLNYLKAYDVSIVNVIKYLLALEEDGYSNKAIGDNLYLLNLIPDSILVQETEKIRSRLNFNILSTTLLSSFSKPLYERISELPLEPNTLQKEVVNFIKAEKEARNAEEICRLISEKYPQLNFSNWKIPDLDFTHIKLFTEEIKSTDFKIEEGKKVLHVEENKISKVRIRFRTNPNPKDISDLKYFKVILMSVDGGAGEEISVLRQLKNTASNRPFREATVELNANIIEEGSYFFKVLAENDHGTVLNGDDDFKEPKIQKAWEEAKLQDENSAKSNFPYKLICDSEDFDYVVDETVERNNDHRKDKLNNVLQAYFKYRIEKLKYEEELDEPIPNENSNIWLNDLRKHTSTFHINYSEKHNYQINLSSKLREIEIAFLKNGNSFGYVKGVLKSNSSAVGYESLQFVESELTRVIPIAILKLREDIFSSIQMSNEAGDGVFETADIFNYREKIKEYIQQLTDWTTCLNEKVSNDNISSEEKSKIQHFLTELQILDIARIKTKLPDGQRTEALLLSPLHPLRLAWSLQLMEVFNDWEQKTENYHGYRGTWTKNLEYLFEGQLSPENNPLVLVEPNSFKSYHYSGELAYGWGLYLNVLADESKNGMTSVSRQMKHYFRQLFNITRDNYVETDISQKLVVRHIKNYLSQHPYTDKLIINLINSGDTSVFADAFVELEKEHSFKGIKYEVRIFKGDDKIIEHGEALTNLINPEFNVSEEAEAFSQPSKNRLFPKLRFSINSISEYLTNPFRFTSHLSFLISPFPITVELIKPYRNNRNFYLNGLLTESTVTVDENSTEIKWNRFIVGNSLSLSDSGAGVLGIKLFDNIQSFIGGALASKHTDSIPSTQLRLNDKDKVLLTHLHDYSDWVVTFDRNLGPQIFDQPSKDGNIPFLLDYVPGEEVTGVTSYLTTRPTSEVLGLLGPHFKEFNLDIHEPSDEKKIKILLEDLRAVSSSLVLQLNSSKNKAFEVIGSAFTKRILEKKGFLEEAFLIPIDLHQNLFENLPIDSKSRADNLLVSFNLEKKEINISIIEIKCRKSLGEAESHELKEKIKEQIENTITALRTHYDPEYHLSFDRLDREIKNKELKSLLSFYIERAHRYEYLNENAYESYIEFLQYLDGGFKLKFNKLGFIFNFSASKKHHKEVIDHDLTFFIFGGKLVEQILDPDSDLNTRRLEENDFDAELSSAIGANRALKPFIQKFKAKEFPESDVVKNDSTSKSQWEEPIDIKSPAVKKSVAVESKEELKLTLQSGSGGIIDKIESGEEIIQNIVHTTPVYDLLIGKGSPSNQFGILGESLHGKKIAIDLSETNTISLFGVQGGGKSYTIGTISEMVLKQFNNVNELPAPLAGVIFHYSESMDYEPEFTSMIYPNDQGAELIKLKERYGADPDNVEDVIILTPRDKIEERQSEYPSIEVLPIAFNSKELSVQDWMFLLGAVGNDSAYIKQLKAIMKEHRRNITLDGIVESVESSELLSNSQKALARQKLSFAREYIDDSYTLRDSLKPGRLIIVDLRDEFIVKDEALGLFVIMLNVFSAVKNLNGGHFNKFIVFDEAHKYMDNKDLTGNIVTAIREMRHKGVSIMIASQDPPSLPNEIIELSSIVLLHKFNSPQWLKHIQKSITQLSTLGPADMSSLMPGEGFLWATKATDKAISVKPVKISTRPRVTKHGGGTIQATGGK